MPRWPMVLFGAAFFWAAPWVVAMLVTLGACMVWFESYRFNLPMIGVFLVLTWIAFGGERIL